MNKYSIKEIEKIYSIKKVNITGDAVFDYLKIVDLNGVKYENEAFNVLCFLSYPTENELNDGWFTLNFDLRPNLLNIFKSHPNYTFVIENDMEEICPSDMKYISVDNIRNFINSLYEYVLNNNSSKVISVTGSVGKTTMVGLLENVLKQKYNVLRIYSKRITPINLQANIINFLTNDIDFIVLENSIYYRDHVKILSTMLKPYICGILNIESSHLGVEKLNSVEDICVFKSEIMRYAKYAFLNVDDDYLKNIKIVDGKVYFDSNYLFDNDNLSINFLSSDSIKVNLDNFIIDGLVIKPFILSNLSMIQYLMCLRIAKLCGLSDNQIVCGLNSYKPVENRLQTEYAFGKEIIFDGDVTTYERMDELSNIIYDKKFLVLRKVGSAENTFRIKNIVVFFNRFDKVFVFSDIDYLEQFKDEDNVIIVSNHDFMNSLIGKIIYHYSGYFRVWDDFNEDNLKIYDREKYIIMKDD